MCDDFGCRTFNLKETPMKKSLNHAQPKLIDGLKYALSEDKTSYRCLGVNGKKRSEIIIPDTFNGLPVTVICESAFDGCYSLRMVKIGDNVREIDEYAFCDCNSLQSVTVGKSVKRIGNFAFEGCFKLVEVINHSDLDIASGKFDDGEIASNAKRVIKDITESKIVIEGDFSFYNDNGEYLLLGYEGDEVNLVLPDKINGQSYQIYQFAFYGNPFLKSVTIPTCAKSIGFYALDECPSLESIIYKGSKKEWKKIIKTDDCDYVGRKYTIYCTDGMIEKT